MLREILEELNEVKGDLDPKAKKHAKVIAKARAKVKCKPNFSPSKVKDTGTSAKFKCTPLDKAKSRKAKKVRNKFNKTASAKKSQQQTQLTKKFRSN